MRLRIAAIAVTFLLAAPAGVVATSFDAGTATLTIDNDGSAGLTFADRTVWTSGGPSAFSMWENGQVVVARLVQREGDRLIVTFEGGATAEFAVDVHPGFAVFRLTKLSANGTVEQFRLFRLGLPPNAQRRAVLNAATSGPNFAVVLSVEPNVHAFLDTSQSPRSDRDGGRHEFAPSPEARAGHTAATFTATSNAEPDGWSMRGRSFDAPLDLTGLKVIRAWVKGDGQGQALKFQLGDGKGGNRDTYRTRPELAVEMLSVLCNHRKDQRFHAVTASAYAGRSVLCCLPANCDLTSWPVTDARLYAPTPERRQGANGRPRKWGERLPTPQEMLAERCRHVSLEIYGRRERMRLAYQVARVHAAPERPLRVVAAEALKGGRGQEAFYSTCQDASAEQVIAWYAMRWSIEVMNHDSKQHLSFEEPQGWTRRSVERTAPMAMLLYSLIALWFAREGRRDWRPLAWPWYTSKTAPSLADVLSTLRRMSMRHQVSELALAGKTSRTVKQLVKNAVTLAV